MFPEPKWLSKLPAKEQKKARAVFKLRIAALYHSRAGSLQNLSISMGNDSNALSATPQISGEKAVLLERIMGRELFPREFFRPDLFVIPE